ncbi:UNVERIFIED_CONTAM: hypothetical protein FKN15_077054, partial [Acipenser sinensis]
ALICAKNLQSFRMFESSSFLELAQSLVDIGAAHGKVNAGDLILSAVTISRFSHEKCAAIKAEILPVIKQAISEASTDMWTDDYRSQLHVYNTTFYR